MDLENSNAVHKIITVLTKYDNYIQLSLLTYCKNIRSAYKGMYNKFLKFLLFILVVKEEKKISLSHIFIRDYFTETTIGNTARV